MPNRSTAQIISKIRETLESADEVAWDVAAENDYPITRRKHSSGYLNPTGALESLMNTVFLDLRILAEELGQREALEAIKNFDNANRSKYGSVLYDHDSEEIDAIGSAEAHRFYRSLSAVADATITVSETPFAQILAATATILHAAGAPPTSEKEVRDPVYEIMTYAYPDVTRSERVVHPGKTYVPDMTSKAAQSYAEYKFVKDRAGMAKAYEELSSDMAGYKGDSAIKYKYAIIYLTGPFVTQAQADAHFASVGKPDDWKIIVLHGAGTK